MASIKQNRGRELQRVSSVTLLVFLGLSCRSAIHAAPVELWSSETAIMFDLRTSKSFLGVGIVDIDRERAKELQLKEQRGVEVTRVEEGSPAVKAGIAVGDILLEFNGQKLESKEQLGRMVRETPVGRKVKILLFRNGTEKAVMVVIGVRKIAGIEVPQGAWNFEMPEMPSFAIPDVPSPYLSWRSNVLGIEFEEIGSQLAEYFGVKEGVLIRAVMKDSPGEKAGLKAGDVITRVAEKPVKNPREITNIVRGEKDKTTIAIGFVRERRDKKVQVQLENSSGERLQRQHFISGP